MPKGRKAQPEAVNDAKGNPGRRRRKAMVACEGSSSSTAPEFLSEAAKKFWDMQAPELAAMRFVRSTDHMAFARYCQHLVTWWDKTKALETEGDTYTTTSEHVVIKRINPDFIVRERVERQLLALEDRFGLNPVYRQQILQRMAGQVTQTQPATGLFDASGETPSALETAAPSAIGILNNDETRH
ncbi:P27 family phage terminase small subunit [Propionivibrio sp.]|uniref:P27 family phage terminase small subunit n=1 Tax=Propionivibrio sp. TaxID=2212460 RepID=UPI00262E469E|nr:P27 family phage terminase small subunit [Propionivibrio sp.]